MEAAGTPGFVVAAAAAGDGGGGGGGSCGRQRQGLPPGSGMGGHCPVAAADPECSRRHSVKFPPCSSSFSLQLEEHVALEEQILETPG